MHGRLPETRRLLDRITFEVINSRIVRGGGKGRVT